MWSVVAFFEQNALRVSLFTHLTPVTTPPPEETFSP